MSDRYVATSAAPGVDVDGLSVGASPDLTPYARLDAAQVFTAKQTLGCSGGPAGAVVACTSTRHIIGTSATSWIGVSHELECDLGGGVIVVLGDIRARSMGSNDAANCYTEMRAGNSRGNYDAGLRCRSTVTGAKRGVELLCASSSGTPVLQPCEFMDGGDLSLTIRPQGTGVLNLLRARPNILRGTVYDITNGVAPFNAPTPGDVVIATDAASGAGALAVYLGSSWLMAPLMPLV